MSRRRMLGEVNLLGLDEFGQFGMNPLWGVAIGGAAAGGTAIMLRHSNNAKLVMYSEALGLLAGLGVSGALYAMKSTRHAAIGSAVGAILASGIAWLEGKLFGTVTVPAAAVAPAAAAGAPVAGMGIPNVRALNGLGIPNVRALNGGLGIPNISNTPHAQGTIPGVAGSQLAGAGMSAPPVSLLGPRSPQAAYLLGMGGPAAHGLAAAYGATLLGGGR